MQKTKTVEDYIRNSALWTTELQALRDLLLATDLAETIKWGAPCYTLSGQNLVGLSGFKSYFGLWFHQGALLSDPGGVLINAQEGKTTAMRQWRMTSAREIDSHLIRQYLDEAIDHAKAGRKVAMPAKKPLAIPPELREALVQDDEARAVFGAMTLGQKREYADYISAAKRDETKLRRLDKVLPMIKANIGLNDKYR